MMSYYYRSVVSFEIESVSLPALFLYMIWLV